MKMDIGSEFPIVATAPMGLGKTTARTINRRARVLIAQEDWAFTDMLIFAFEDVGCEVVAVGDGTSLLEVLGTSMMPKSPVKPFDLVISDILTPGWTGLVALENLSHGPKVPPVVVITAFGCLR